MMMGTIRSTQEYESGEKPPKTPSTTTAMAWWLVSGTVQDYQGGKDITTDMQSILTRLEKVEKQNRWIKRIGVLVLLFAGSACLTVGGLATGRNVEAKEFVLVDAAGKKRGALAMTEMTGPPRSPALISALTLSDEGGEMRVKLAGAASGSALTFYDAAGKERKTQGVTASGSVIGF